MSEEWEGGGGGMEEGREKGEGGRGWRETICFK